VATAIVLGCMSVSLGNWFFDPRYGKEEVRPLAGVLAKRPSDLLVVADNARVLMPLNFYGAELPASTLAVDNIQWGRTPQNVVDALGRGAPLPTTTRVWLIRYRSWETDPRGEVTTWMDRNLQFVQEQHWGGVSFRQYRRK
jgi:hypothetical protein